MSPPSLYQPSLPPAPVCLCVIGHYASGHTKLAAGGYVTTQAGLFGHHFRPTHSARVLTVGDHSCHCVIHEYCQDLYISG